MRFHHSGSGPHVQGSPRPLRIRHGAAGITDGGGLLLVRKLFDASGLGSSINARRRGLGGSSGPG